MNKQDLVAKIAKDAELSKTSASAVVESFIDGITKCAQEGRLDHICRVWHVQDLGAEGAARPQPADGRGHQDSEAPRRPLHRRQRTEESRPLTAIPVLGR